MEHKYIVETSIPRNFDSKVGVTLDSIVESCRGIVNWSIPLTSKYTKIHITTNKHLEVEYLTRQLNSEFRKTEEVVLDIIEKRNGDNKLYIP